VLFIAVAALGILLGREYQGRIHVLKNAREKRLAACYPATGGLILSEIKMLNVVLVFLSSSGLVLVWLNALTANEGRSWEVGNLSVTFWALFCIFISLGTYGIGWVSWMTARWFLRARH
jgi:hypothetical protein